MFNFNAAHRAGRFATVTASFLAALMMVAQPAGAAGGATITVTSANKDLNANDDNCTLLEAILNANLGSDTTLGDCAAGTTKLDTIVFDIPGGGNKTIDLTGGSFEIPEITNPLIIDGNTQPGSSSPGIGINCGSLGTIGLEFGPGSKGSRATGFAITNCLVAGIALSGGGTTVEYSWVGTSDGTSSTAGNPDGIKISSSGNVIRYNVISANAEAGVSIVSGSGNVIAGNFIGTTDNGGAPLGNHRGIKLESGVTGTTIGGTKSYDTNVISTNTGSGIFISAGAKTTKVLHNIIGPASDAYSPLSGKAGTGIYDAGTGTVIGGAMPAASNFLADNQTDIRVDNNSAGMSTISGNIFDTTSGNTPLASTLAIVVDVNGLASIKNNLLGSADNNTILLDTGARLKSSSGNCLLSGTGNFANFSNIAVTFTKNWWDSPAGPNNGVALSNNGISTTTATPFLTAPPLSCLGFAPKSTNPKDPAAVNAGTSPHKFSWAKVPTADTYEFTLSTQSDMTGAMYEALDTSGASFISIPALPYDTYYWRTSTTTLDNFEWPSAVHTFYVTIQKTPKPGASVKHGTVKFTWYPYSPTPTDYAFSAYSDSACTTPDPNVSPNSTTGLSVTTQSAVVSTTGVHYWNLSINSGATGFSCMPYVVK